MRYFAIPLKFSVYIPNVLNLRIYLYSIYTPIIDTQQVQQVSTVSAKLPQMTNNLVIPELIRDDQPWHIIGRIAKACYRLNTRKYQQ